MKAREALDRTMRRAKPSSSAGSPLAGRVRDFVRRIPRRPAPSEAGEPEVLVYICLVCGETWWFHASLDPQHQTHCGVTAKRRRAVLVRE